MQAGLGKEAPALKFKGDRWNNKGIYSKESNPNAKAINELKFGSITLLKIKNGNIVKYIEYKKAIRTELNI